MDQQTTIPTDFIESKIYLVRWYKVMLDSDLAILYSIPTKALNQQVRRNKDRFPTDFMFILNKEEKIFLRSHFVTSNIGRGGRRYLPMVFTEQGVAMPSILKSQNREQKSVLG